MEHFRIFFANWPKGELKTGRKYSILLVIHFVHLKLTKDEVNTERISLQKPEGGNFSARKYPGLHYNNMLRHHCLSIMY